MNDLSGSIDLQSTLVRAELLFRRFRRTIEAVDRKGNFPAPNVRQRKTDAKAAGATGDNARSSAIDNASKISAQADPARKDGVDGRATVSPELRHLLSTQVDVLDKTEVVANGGGIN